MVILYMSMALSHSDTSSANGMVIGGSSLVFLF